MLVIRVESLDRRRRKIQLDDGTKIVLYEKEVYSFHIEEGTELLKEQYEEMCSGILIPRARKRAMYLLEKVDRTEAQLWEKLQQNYYPSEVIEDAIAYVKKYRYVDDFRYACNYIRYCKDTKSRRQIMAELCQKGVPKGVLEQAMDEEFGEVDESCKIQQWLVKKNYNSEQADVKEKQRVYQFLLRKGFQSEDILRLL